MDWSKTTNYKILQFQLIKKSGALTKRCRFFLQTITQRYSAFLISTIPLESLPVSPITYARTV